jgi:hypothetical protein
MTERVPMSDRISTSVFPSNLKPKWRERFEFFERYGEPSSPEFKAELKSFSTGSRLFINMNWFGFFFGPIYLLALGMWRRALTWVGIMLALALVEDAFGFVTHIKFSRPVDFGISVGVGMLIAMTTNYSYYLKVMKGDNGWNPFKGMR